MLDWIIDLTGWYFDNDGYGDCSIWKGINSMYRLGWHKHYTFYVSQF